jgi:tetratricopeptide (TPR) repeat protein
MPIHQSRWDAYALTDTQPSSACRTCVTRPLGHLLCVVSLLALAVTCQAQTEDPRAVFDRAVSDFQSGRIAESVSGFDRLVRLAPDALPQLWQRGIALYYAGRYQECRDQFESHRTVNPNDVENAAWHFLCVARAESPAKAKAALLPVGPDSRVPMSHIYRMFGGKLDPEQVLKAGGTQPQGQFYAELYVGLYLEVSGKAERALKHIRNAADDRYSAAGYMHSVARVHRDLAARRPGSTKP